MARVPLGHYPPAMNFPPLQRLALPLLAAAVLTLLSAGCNTAKGVGKDVEKLGDKIQDKSGK